MVGGGGGGGVEVEGRGEETLITLGAVSFAKLNVADQSDAHTDASFSSSC